METEGSLLPVGLRPVSAITQEPNLNPIAFLERLKEVLQKFINLDLDSYKGQVILKDKFLSQYASDIRIKLQQLQQQDPAASLDEMVQTATNTFHNREQEREAKAQERERRKDCCPFLLLPSIFPSIRVFSNESALCIRWPKYWIGVILQMK